MSDNKTGVASLAKALLAPLQEAHNAEVSVGD